MNPLRQVLVPSLPLTRLRGLIGEDRYQALDAAASNSRRILDGHTVFNVNSTASGGGVAEMLAVLVGYTRGAGLDVRWLVAHGDPEFFEITKRIHNRIHGSVGDDGDLGSGEAEHYNRVCAENALLLREQVRPGDLVLLHDPQTAGLCAAMRDHGARVVWRSHIGANLENEWTRQAWSFLLPHVMRADAFVFSRREYVPAELPDERVHVSAPSIDPFAPKNRPLSSDEIDRITSRTSVYPGDFEGPAMTFLHSDGSEGRVERRAAVIGNGPLDRSLPLVVQVSRWDRLKDMRGVMLGFAEGVVGRVDANLALVGPSVADVADDPEGAEVLHECIAAWHDLPIATQDHIRLVSLPMDDVEENALMVNALQRASTIVVQKSLAEGFGLTVAEAMWKAKPMVASAVGGIVDQLAPGTGVLLDDPTDLEEFGRVVADLLERPDELSQLGTNARAYVVDHFVGDRHLIRYAGLLAELL